MSTNQTQPQKIVLHPRIYAADSKEIKQAFEHAGVTGVRELDPRYRVLPKDEMLQCIRAAHTASEKYVADWHDCDKFARELWARVPRLSQCNSIAIVLNYAGGHAFNAVLVTAGSDNPYVELLIVEPQNDGVVKLNSTAPYTLVDGQYEIFF